MAQIYEAHKDYEIMKNIYCEAIQSHSDNQKEYWGRLADIYQTRLDWEGQLEVYFSATVTNPDNMKDYSKNICRLANALKARMLFPPAITILSTAMDRHPAQLAQCREALADTYMAAREWEKARDLYKTLLDGPRSQEFKPSSTDLAHAYLALGDTTRALALYSQDHLAKQASGDYSGLSWFGAPAHMVAGDFPTAVRLLKADITHQAKAPKIQIDYGRAIIIAGRHFNLGLCYEALNRSQEAQAAFSNASNVWQECKEDLISTKEYYRTRARPMMSYGYVLEKLGRFEEAKSLYDAAERISRLRSLWGMTRHWSGSTRIAKLPWRGCPRRVVLVTARCLAYWRKSGE